MYLVHVGFIYFWIVTNKVPQSRICLWCYVLAAEPVWESMKLKNVISDLDQKKCLRWKQREVNGRKWTNASIDGGLFFFTLPWKYLPSSSTSIGVWRYNNISIKDVYKALLHRSLCGLFCLIDEARNDYWLMSETSSSQIVLWNYLWR